MPDYEIRLFKPDGTLDVVHMSHHDSDAEALRHAGRLKGEHVRFEIRCGERVVAAR